MPRKRCLYQVSMSYFPSGEHPEYKSAVVESFTVLADNADEARTVAAREFVEVRHWFEGEASKNGRYVMNECKEWAGGLCTAAPSDIAY